MALLNLFPTQLYHSRPAAGPKGRRLIADLTREAYVFRGLDTAGRRWSKEHYPSGYTSYSSISDLPYRSPTFGELKTLLDREAAKYARLLELDLSGGELRLKDCWVNIMKKGCHHSYHLHPLCVISGTFFLQTPPGGGAFKIEDPRLPNYMAAPPHKKSAAPRNRRFYDFRPKAGDLILFESWLKHEVVESRAAEDRISVSFNYEWA